MNPTPAVHFHYYNCSPPTPGTPRAGRSRSTSDTPENSPSPGGTNSSSNHPPRCPFEAFHETQNGRDFFERMGQQGAAAAEPEPTAQPAQGANCQESTDTGRSTPLTDEYPKPIPDPPRYVYRSFFQRVRDAVGRMFDRVVALIKWFMPKVQLGIGINLFRFN